jgi:ABC-type branched-subunit amino acid transport system substrate-binding protein
MLGICLVVAGCYGSTQPVVKIGLLAPFEELYRDDGYAALHAVKLAIAQRNAQGGVAGRQIALVALNDNGRAVEAILQARKLGIDNGVAGVVGPVHGETATAAAAELTAQGLPWIAPVPLDTDEHPGGWSLSASPFDLGHEAVSELVRLGAAEQAVLFSDQLGAIQGAQASADSLGLRLSVATAAAGGASVPAGSSIVWLSDAERGAALVSALASTGSAALVVGGPEVGSVVFDRRAAPGAAAAWLSSGPPASALPPEFVAAYKQFAGTGPSPQAVLAYDATNLLLDAIAATEMTQGRISRPAVRGTLAELLTRGWAGLSGLYAWDDRGCAQASDCGQWLEVPLYVQRGDN